MAGDVGGLNCTDSELLLHPELLSQEFLLLTLEQALRKRDVLSLSEISGDSDLPFWIIDGSERGVRSDLRGLCKNIAVENDVRINKDNLTDLYVQHAIPLPQRELPKNRWGKMMEKKREQHELKSETKRSSTVDGLKKRPLIVFDGSSTSTSIKVKKTENGDNDRLKPPPQNHDLTHRKNPSGPVKSPPLSPVGTTPVKLKRVAPKEEAEATNNLKPPEAKRKIQHVTWP
ncbi:PREDICTED: ashwin isoform X3 [Hipposideros armiger]|uniref:Ashwin n=1 Tax=Hipposideros armiger TaxID=186990 RepID=A0A8B7Q4B7_HIPAR|nr:PREDICTED: ashwin isoform X3 [Hipposideros armiger]